MKSILLLLTILGSTSVFSQDTDDRMKKYLNANGTVNYYSGVIDRMFDFLKTEYEGQQIPDKVWTELKEVKEDALVDITDLIIQSYEGHFAKEELVEMLAFYNTITGQKVLFKETLGPEDVANRDAFYSSPLGQKISSSTESLNNVLQKITQEWSAQLFRDVQHKLKEKGYTKG